MNPIGYLETSVLFCGENLDRLPEFANECVDLVYLDPPFFYLPQSQAAGGAGSE